MNIQYMYHTGLIKVILRSIYMSPLGQCARNCAQIIMIACACTLACGLYFGVMSSIYYDTLWVPGGNSNIHNAILIAIVYACAVIPICFLIGLMTTIQLYDFYHYNILTTYYFVLSDIKNYQAGRSMHSVISTDRIGHSEL